MKTYQCDRCGWSETAVSEAASGIMTVTIYNGADGFKLVRVNSQYPCGNIWTGELCSACRREFDRVTVRGWNEAVRKFFDVYGMDVSLEEKGCGMYEGADCR